MTTEVVTQTAAEETTFDQRRATGESAQRVNEAHLKLPMRCGLA